MTSRLGRGSDQAFPAPVHTRTPIITFSNAKTFLNAFFHNILTCIIAVSIVNKTLLIAFGETWQAFATADLIVLNNWVYKKSWSSGKFIVGILWNPSIGYIWKPWLYYTRNSRKYYRGIRFDSSYNMDSCPSCVLSLLNIFRSNHFHNLYLSLYLDKSFTDFHN